MITPNLILLHALLQRIKGIPGTWYMQEVIEQLIELELKLSTRSTDKQLNKELSYEASHSDTTTATDSLPANRQRKQQSRSS